MPIRQVPDEFTLETTPSERAVDEDIEAVRGGATVRRRTSASGRLNRPATPAAPLPARAVHTTASAVGPLSGLQPFPRSGGSPDQRQSERQVRRSRRSYLASLQRTLRSLAAGRAVCGGRTSFDWRLRRARPVRARAAVLQTVGDDIVARCFCPLDPAVLAPCRVTVARWSRRYRLGVASLARRRRVPGGSCSKPVRMPQLPQPVTRAPEHRLA